AALARQGAAAIRALNQRAWALMREGWLRDAPGGLNFLDPPLDRWLGGLLFPRPRCHDPGLPEGREYRAFLDRADLAQASHALDLAEFWGRLLLELLGIDPSQLKALAQAPIHAPEPAGLRQTMVVATWLARQDLGLTGLEPLPPAQLSPAVAALKAGLQGPLAKRMNQSCQALGDPAAAALCGEVMRQVLWSLAQDLGRLDPGQPLDPRFVNALVIGR
ncbi:MAG: DUF6178 family protein, partial [Pseudomonadota bacterium]